ncbi:MAG: hypothetical protein AAF626_00320 [Pseudomonadota bacterium]
MVEPNVAVITGSTGGIGSAIARQLGAAGWVLMLVNRNRSNSRKIGGLTRAFAPSKRGRNGIYVTDSKEKPLPTRAADPAIQTALMNKLVADAAAT